MAEIYWKKDKTKTRRVVYLIYLDSVEPDYINIISSLNVKAVLSPVHDKDLNEDGTLLKPHRHLVVIFDGPITWQNAYDFGNDIKAYQHFQKLKSGSDMINYLTHDSYRGADKFKYSKDDIIYINSNEYDYIDNDYKLVINYINENHIYNINSLINRLLSSSDTEKLVKWVINNTYFVNQYMKSFNDLHDYSWLESQSRDFLYWVSTLYRIENKIPDKFKEYLWYFHYDELFERNNVPDN